MTTQTPSPDLIAIKHRQQITWASGDFAEIGSTLPLVSGLLGEAAGPLAAARRFCTVTGVDYVPALLERGRERAIAERLPVTFADGDAEALPFPAAHFDATLSTFGVMFAPNQERTAQELLRVTRPGGVIALANWTPAGFIGEMFRVIARHVPPPAGLKPPLLWGTESRLRELFGDQATITSATERHFVFRHRSPAHWVEFFRAYYGPTLKAFEALDEAGQAALMVDLIGLAARSNVAGDGALAMPAAYLEVVLTRR
jgi:SAM-dependent methyltransferase